MAAMPKLHMIQASYGDCMLLEIPPDPSVSTSTKKFWLVDGGPGNQGRSATFKVTNNSLFATLNSPSLKVDRLERVIITHNDRDHTYGAYALISTLKDAKISEATGVGKEYLKFVSWLNGYISMNPLTGPKQFPIDHVWFNDLNVLKAASFINEPNNKGTGWLFALFRSLQTYYPFVTFPIINDDWHGTPVVMQPPGTSLPFSNITKITGPTPGQLVKLWKSRKYRMLGVKSGPPPWKQTALEYKQAKDSNAVEMPSSIEKWGTDLETPTSRLGDPSETNLSSIMFEFTSKSGKRILMTGDGDGDTLYTAYNETAPATFNIIKICHHGSCHNNNIMHKADGSPIVAREGIQYSVQRFFSTFRAEKYVISSDTLNRTPNPDIETVTYMGKGSLFASQPAHPVKAVYFTNGMTYKSWRAFYYASDSSKTMQNTEIDLKVLKHGDSVDFGTVLPTVKPSDALAVKIAEANWINLANDQNWYQYFVVELPAYFVDQVAEADEQKFTTSAAKTTFILDLLLKLPANVDVDSTPTTYIGPGTKRKATDSLALTKKSRRQQGLAPEIMAKIATPVVHARSLLKTAVLASVPTIQPIGSLSWHDVMIANLLGRGDLAAQEADDMSLPPTVTNVVEDGITPNWVDLPTFINLIEKNNNSFVPTSNRPRLDPSFIPMLRWWFVGQDGKTPETNVLASMLLNAFLNEYMVSELFVALPLNENGAAAFAADPLAAFKAGTTLNTAAAMLCLTLTNFRAKVIAPTASEYSAGRNLEVVTFYFELNLPPKGMFSTTETDLWTWTLPFSNDSWTRGNALFQHQVGSSLKVKMMWPLYQDATTFCQFAGDFKISRTSPVTLPVLGTMYAARGQPASYDIQFTGNNGKIPAIDLLSIFSPTAELGTAMFAEFAASVNIPGVDLTTVLKNDLVLRDAGLILRQHAQNIQSIAIEDLYGTIAISDVLHLATDLLPFPASLQIPSNLPDLTVTMSNVTGSTSHKYTFAFSQVVEGLGTIAFQTGVGPDGQTQFDIFAISQQNTSVGDMLTKLSSGTLLAQFESASLFTNSLAGLYVPYVHLSFGPTTPYQASSGYSMQQLTLAVNLATNVAIPSGNPFVTLEDLSLEIIYGGAADGLPSDISVFGSATVNLGGYDANCIFQVDHTADEIQAFLDEDSPDTTGPTSSDSTGGFQGTVMLTIDFPNETPTVGAMIEGLLGEIPDASGLNSLTKNIPSQLLSILDSNVFEAVEFQIQNDATTGNKWQVVYFHVQARLEGLGDILNLLPGISFDIPVLDVYISYPSDPAKKSYQVTLGSIISLQGGVCNIAASFDSPPPAFESLPNECLSVSLNTDYSHPGLPLGHVVTSFIGVALDALDVNVQNLVPQEVQDTVNSITIDEARIAFLNTGTNGWKTKFVECQISSAAPAWSPFSQVNFQISQVSLHFSHDFGIAVSPAAVTPATTQVELNATLAIKSLTINVAFTYNSVTSGWTIAFSSGQTIKLVDVIENAIDGLGFQIPPSISDEIDSILVIDTNSFYIAHAAGNNKVPESFAFSNDGQITLFGIGVSNISVFCNRPSSGGPWSYTVALALPNPCTPLADFAGPLFSFLSGIVIKDGQFAYFSGNPAPQVVGPSVQLPDNLDSSHVVLSGKIFLGGNPFMQLISSIVKLDEVDICVLPGAVTISIPAASLGLNIMNVFKVDSFSFDIFVGGYGLGAKVELDADWLSTTPVTASFTLIIMDDGAFGADIQIMNITNPFGIPGIALQNANFSLVWLAEAMEPQSMSAGASLVVTEPGAEQISGSFSLSMNEVTPSSNYFKMNIMNLTLVNLINTMTHGSCPAIFSKIDIGFKLLAIDLEPSALNFTFDADFYIFAIEGKVHAAVQISTGISFGANLDPVNIIDLIKITAYKDSTKGPFIYLDSTIKDISSGNLGPPAWIGVTSADDPNLKGSIFALSASLVFLDLDLDVYGVINTQGLQLNVTGGRGLSVPGVDFEVSQSFSITINSKNIVTGTEFKFNMSLDLPEIDFAGISLGSFDGTLVSLDDALSLTVYYTASDWQDDSAAFTATINANVLGLTINEAMTLDVTIRKLEDIPNAIEQFIKDQVVNYLKNYLLGPILQTVEKAKELANKAMAEMTDFFNMVGSDIVAVMTDLGHDIANIADALANTLGYSIDEVAGALFDFGHDINEIGNIIGDVFNAAPQEVLSALTSAGVTIEHAVDAVFDEAGAELSKDFNLVGNSVAGFALDAASTIEHFLTGNLTKFVDNTISEAGQFFDGVGQDIDNFFTGGDCEIM